VLEPQVAAGALYGFVSDTYFIDIGIPEDYEAAKKVLVI
jgi:D-glycero-alpha-D-manno-heptose 1-phosphate guanylyltransferase